MSLALEHIRDLSVGAADLVAVSSEKFMTVTLDRIRRSPLLSSGSRPELWYCFGPAGREVKARDLDRFPFAIYMPRNFFLSILCVNGM